MRLPLFRDAARAAAAAGVAVLLAALLVGCNETVVPPSHISYLTFDGQATTTEGNNLRADLWVDQLAYDLGDTLLAHLVIRNVGTLESRIFWTEQYELHVNDETEPREIYRWSSTSPGGTRETRLAPGDSVAFEIDWNMRDSLGAALPAGHDFTLIGTPFQLAEPYLTRPRLTFTARGTSQ